MSIWMKVDTLTPMTPRSGPSVVAACIQDRHARTMAGRLHGLKRDVLGKERMEMKGVKLINRATFRRRHMEVAFVEEFFSALLNLPITVFAMIMERPTEAPDPNDMKLPDQFRFLTQRVQLLAESKEEMATLLFDGSPGQLGGLSFKFGAFLYRSEEGRACINITDTPFFGDSRASAGVQIADMIASVIRQLRRGGALQEYPHWRHIPSCPSGGTTALLNRKPLIRLATMGSLDPGCTGCQRSRAVAGRWTTKSTNRKEPVIAPTGSYARLLQSQLYSTGGTNVKVPPWQRLWDGRGDRLGPHRTIGNPDLVLTKWQPVTAPACPRCGASEIAVHQDANQVVRALDQRPTPALAGIDALYSGHAVSSVRPRSRKRGCLWLVQGADRFR